MTDNDHELVLLKIARELTSQAMTLMRDTLASGQHCDIVTWRALDRLADLSARIQQAVRSGAIVEGEREHAFA